jgi:hypothetical protein
VVRITVKIRAPGQQQVQAACSVDVFLDKGGAVIRMKCFHGVQTRSSQRWNSQTKAPLSGMSDRRDPSSVVNDLDHRFRAWAFTRHEAGLSTAEPPIEGLLRACHVSSLDHRACHLRPPNRSAALPATLFEHRLDVDWDPMGREA